MTVLGKSGELSSALSPSETDFLCQELHFSQKFKKTSRGMREHQMNQLTFIKTVT